MQSPKIIFILQNSAQEMEKLNLNFRYIWNVYEDLFIIHKHSVTHFTNHYDVSMSLLLRLLLRIQRNNTDTTDRAPGPLSRFRGGVYPFCDWSVLTNTELPLVKRGWI